MMKYSQNFVKFLASHYTQDEKYNNLVSRIVNKGELTKEINKITRNLSSKELEDKMDNEGISASICNDLNKVHLDPQVIEQGSIVEIDHPELGKMRMPKPPANLKGQKEFPRTLAPILGFDNRQICLLYTSPSPRDGW